MQFNDKQTFSESLSCCFMFIHEKTDEQCFSSKD